MPGLPTRRKAISLVAISNTTTDAVVYPSGNYCVPPFIDGSFLSSDSSTVTGFSWVPRPYGVYFDTTEQTSSSSTGSYKINFNNTVTSRNLTLQSGSQFHVQHSGLYNVQFSIQFINSDTAEHAADVWLKIDGANYDSTRSRVTIPKKHGSFDGSHILSLNIIPEIQARSYFELWWWTDDSRNIKIKTIPEEFNPTRPPSPGVILTIVPVY